MTGTFSSVAGGRPRPWEAYQRSRKSGGDRPGRQTASLASASKARGSPSGAGWRPPVPQAWPGGGAATVMRLLVAEQPAVVDVGDDLGAVGGRVEAVEAQHHRLPPGLELAVPAQGVGAAGVGDVLEADRLRVGPGQGDVRRVLGERRWRVDGGEVDLLRVVGHVDGGVEDQGVGRWGDAAVDGWGTGVAAWTDWTRYGACSSPGSLVPAG